MKFIAAIGATLLLTSFGQALAQAPANPFPMAAPAGQDSRARENAPAGAVNQGPFNAQTWRYGPAFNAGTGGPLWNPVKVKLKSGQKVTGGTVSATTDPAIYCAMANAGYDYIWTEIQHANVTWDQVAKMWRTCPDAKAVPAARVPYADEMQIQHAVDAGAMVIIVPTVDSEAEAIEARNWTYFPPLGRRSQGGNQAGAMYPGVNYRNTFNENVVLILMIETMEGVQDAEKIARVEGVDAIFAASSDLNNFSGYVQGTPDYERVINIVHDAAIKAGKKLCGPFAWANRPDFTCFQNRGEIANIMAGARAELGSLFDTQGVVTVGPYATKK